ncbi:tyrosine-type recombinase/integrase [Thermodesulfobacteriota bacterium]
MACITKKRGKLVIDFYDQHGKRRLKTLPVGTTKTQAKKELRDIEQMVERGTYLPREGIPIFEKVAEDWLEYKKPNIRHSTFQQYRGHVNNHLIPYFGTTKINRMNFSSIEKFMSHSIANEVTPPTLKKLLVTLGSIFKYAVIKKFCEYNPVREIEKPKTSKKKKVTVLQPEEIRAFVKNARDRKYRCMYTLSIMSGMRQGELLGLKWLDIDWFNCQVNVRRTFNHDHFYEPKSEASRRSIDLGPSVISELKKWKIACPSTKLNLIFPNEAGKPMDANGLFKREFKTTLRRAKLRDIRFHDLRHTFASLLIDQGEHPKYIQSQLGHSSINVTMDTYGHLMRAVNPEASNKLDKAVFGEIGDFLETKNKRT